MKYEFFVGGRYLRSARGGFVSFIAAISMLGVAIGVAVLLVVLSVMNGFEFELHERILSQTAHGGISAFGSGLSDWRRIEERAEADPRVLAAAPYIKAQTLLAKEDGVEGVKTSGAMIWGIAPEREQRISKLSTQMRTGDLAQLQSGDFGIVLGEELARALNAHVGERVVMLLPQATITIAGAAPRFKRFTVVGIFAAGMYEYDRHFAYTHVEDAARVLRMGGDVTGVRFTVRDLYQAPRVARELAQEMGGGFYAEDWTRQLANFFELIALTKRMMFMILSLVVGVAAFNIVSTLVMIVKDKRADIAILRTMGATPRGILEIFTTQGMLIGVLGIMAGLALGAVLAGNLQSLVHALEQALHTRFLDPKLYYMGDLPAVVQWGDVLTIGGVAFALCCLATIYPAYRAARTQPAQALRHE